MLRESVAAEIFVVHVYLYWKHCQCPRHADYFRKLHCHDIAEKRLVRIVGKENPLLVLSEAEQADLLVELDLVRLLRHAPGRVSTSADSVLGHLYLEDLLVPVEPVRILDPECAGNIILLVCHRALVHGVDPYDRELRPDREGHLHRIFEKSSVLHPEVIDDSLGEILAVLSAGLYLRTDGNIVSVMLECRDEGVVFKQVGELSCYCSVLVYDACDIFGE